MGVGGSWGWVLSTLMWVDVTPWLCKFLSSVVVKIFFPTTLVWISSPGGEVLSSLMGVGGSWGWVLSTLMWVDTSGSARSSCGTASVPASLGRNPKTSKGENRR